MSNESEMIERSTVIEEIAKVVYQAGRISVYDMKEKLCDIMAELEPNKISMHVNDGNLTDMFRNYMFETLKHLLGLYQENMLSEEDFTEKINELKIDTTN